MSLVRPVPARVVRQDHAVQTVSRMLDALPASERPAALAGHAGTTRPADLDAYDDTGPAFFVYRLRGGGPGGDTDHVGVVGEVGAQAFHDGRVRGHEAVQPDRVESLVAHYTNAAVRSELVALLHQTGPGFATAVEETMATPPLVSFTGPDSWAQEVWRVPDEVAVRLAEDLSGAVHYVADGHHRVAASLRVWETSRAPDAGLMCVMYPLDGLRLLAFHRRINGPVDAEELLELATKSFDVAELSGPDHAVGSAVYVGGRWHDVTWSGVRPPGAAGLDIALLDAHLVEPLLGRASGRVEITSALSDRDELVRACDEDGGALVVLKPPSLEQLTDVADRGEVMPPKTTYFDPKPYAGIFLR